MRRPVQLSWLLLRQRPIGALRLGHHNTDGRRLVSTQSHLICMAHHAPPRMTNQGLAPGEPGRSGATWVRSSV